MFDDDILAQGKPTFKALVYTLPATADGPSVFRGVLPYSLGGDGGAAEFAKGLPFTRPNFVTLYQTKMLNCS